jgi:hypothetical protein
VSCELYRCLEENHGKILSYADSAISAGELGSHVKVNIPVVRLVGLLHALTHAPWNKYWSASVRRYLSGWKVTSGCGLRTSCKRFSTKAKSSHIVGALRSEPAASRRGQAPAGARVFRFSHGKKRPASRSRPWGGRRRSGNGSSSEHQSAEGSGWATDSLVRGLNDLVGATAAPPSGEWRPHFPVWLAPNKEAGKQH